MLLSFLGKILLKVSQISNYLKRAYIKKQMKSIGNNVYIGSDCHFTPTTITIGEDVYIGRGCCFQSKHGRIVIGNHVMFGPGVHIHGGNHEFKHLGHYMKESDFKGPEEDGVVTIEEDCWIGACAIILKGVTIGKGSVVGAGSIVTKNIPPYSIYMNKINPVVKPRFDEEEIVFHEKSLAERHEK